MDDKLKDTRYRPVTNYLLPSLCDCFFFSLINLCLMDLFVDWLSGPAAHERHDVGTKLFGLVLQKLGVADVLDKKDQEILMFNLLLSAAVVRVLAIILCCFLVLYRTVRGLSLCCIPRSLSHPVDVATATLRRFFQGESGGEYWNNLDQGRFFMLF